MIKLELSIGTVEVIDTLTWGMQDDIKQAIREGLRIKEFEPGQKKFDVDFGDMDSRGKYKALELCVKKITLKDGKEIAFSKEWMRNLSVEDGDKIMDAVNEVTSPKKA